jgi:hypothetical protein
MIHQVLDKIYKIEIPIPFPLKTTNVYFIDDSPRTLIDTEKNGGKRLFLRHLRYHRFFAAKPFTFQNRLERSQSLLPQKGVDDFLASGWIKQKWWHLILCSASSKPFASLSPSK